MQLCALIVHCVHEFRINVRPNFILGDIVALCYFYYPMNTTV